MRSEVAHVIRVYESRERTTGRMLAAEFRISELEKFTRWDAGELATTGFTLECSLLADTSTEGPISRPLSLAIFSHHHAIEWHTEKQKGWRSW